MLARTSKPTFKSSSSVSSSLTSSVKASSNLTRTTTVVKSSVAPKTQQARDKSIYVGNLPWGASESQVQSLFGEYGPVMSVKIMTDRDTGKPRGFCFVEMEDNAADKAISSLNGHSFLGRNLRVDAVRPRPERNSNQ